MTDKNGMGILIPIGGNEDKGHSKNENYTLDFIESGILAHVLRESGGPNASILVIPTASSIPIEVAKNYQDAFAKLGCYDVKIANIRTRQESDNPQFIEWMKEVDCVMFSGGDQSRISRRIGGTELHQIMLERYQNEGLVIAGTSAGAMMMSGEMIAGGTTTEAFFKGSVKMHKGLDLLSGLIIDSHFIQRGRFGRMTEAVAKFPEKLGVGLSEDTGLVIRENRYCKVIGSGMVILFDPSKVKHNNEKILRVGTPMTIIGLEIHVLSAGDTIDLETRVVKAAPMEEWVDQI